MSNQTTSSVSANLFARKGTAQPVGPGTFDDQARNDNEEIETVSPEAAPDSSNPAASLFSIDFKKRTATDEAILAAIGMAVETETPMEDQRPASATLETPRPAPSVERTPASLILVLLVAVCVGAGIWYVLHQKRMMADRQIAAAAPASSESGTTSPESAQGAQGDSVQSEMPSGGDTAAAAESESTATAPSFDLIRIEPNGEAVIAGRAVPGSELILLDNGEPIGTVTADWAGEWAFVPEKPLAPGNHKFSLVIMTPQGTVIVPAVGAPDKGTFLDPAESGKAISQLKGGDYVIQLSSTTTLKGAKRELTKLQRNFGDLLGSKQLSVHQGKLSQGSIRYRVRSDAFAEKEAARKLCAAFRAKRQDCLVIKR